ncbi:3-isopropylmalate dehydratase large subunit [Sporomusa aerivorans]|uniref:3-isopropylmalate dehydratase large subunit n=1 Tax=Sporomusa aerivorans TaxID=204936 RepID=UPI00352B8F74
MSQLKTMFDKIWEIHAVKKISDDNYLLFIDRCYLHDLSGPLALKLLTKAGLKPLNKNLVVASPDHTVSSKPNRCFDDTFSSKAFIPLFREECLKHDIPLFDLNDPKQGIIHVIGPELGISLPGMTIVCGDSHTCTHGAMGALAWGIGTSELYHILATQTLVVKKPKTMRVNIEGEMSPGIEPMDIILHIIAKHGSDFGVGYAVEYSGEAIRKLDMEGRMTICNLTVEFGSEYGFIAPDSTTFEYITNREYAPKDANFAKLIEHCKSMVTDNGAKFDKEITVSIKNLKPQISWGVTPSHTIGIDEVIPDPQDASTENLQNGWIKALEYMDFQPGQKMENLLIDRVFIGSCSNGRISNLERVAKLVQGKKVAEHVEAWIVSGSEKVKKEAEMKGLDKVFKEAGFLWGEPGCSLCGGANGEQVGPGKRCVSTTNRNFIGRQGPKARTHLASPSTAAAAAIGGKIVDVRQITL